ncbi:hypothetical protein [Flavobacterium lipolyticum]|uniref:Uncharacterized protein n=1 Tax=Flavobacterium lipolyticum TaxID=2893754 RepID=A0ABS8LY07_9FLAO|nr:hypothetical protein [Flavobacterium sp. F-126]MCC9017446.1 hypothetical protein [Flavobacterium sp. F-126]
MRKTTIILLPLLFFLQLSIAQSQIGKEKRKEFRKSPKWKEMMKNPNANFNETSVAFEEFWKGKPNPLELMEGEEEALEELKERSFISRLFKSNRALKKESLQYVEDFKRFKFWRIQSEGLIKSDGRIMSEDEIQEMARQELQRRQETKQ